MLWSLVLLGIIILGLGASIFIMASRIKPNNTTVKIDGLDLSDFIDKLAKAIGEEVAKKIGTQRVTVHGSSPDAHELFDEIKMDDSVIPMKVDTSNLEGNLENMSKEEIKVDKDIEKNKSKLAGLMKRKKK